MNNILLSCKQKVVIISGFCLLFFVFCLPSYAQKSGITKRVQFGKGKTSTTIKGNVAPGKKDTYIFRAKENQSITVTIEWQGKRGGLDEQLSGFVFIHPDGTQEEDPQSDVFVAGEEGDFKVIIRTKSRRSVTAYIFTLTIQ